MKIQRLKKIQEEIDKLNESCKMMEISLQALGSEKEEKVKTIQDLKASKERIERLTLQIEAVKQELRLLYEKKQSGY